MSEEEITILNIYNEDGETLTNLIQTWINENYFFWNLNNDIDEIEYNCTNK